MLSNELKLDGDRQGSTYSHEFDYERLNAQMRRVFDVVKDGEWVTLRELSEMTGSPEASVSARLRDFRKKQFGGFLVERNRVAGGLYEYRLVQENKEK
jgi:hypothetical protein